MKRLLWLTTVLISFLSPLSAYYPCIGGCSSNWVCQPVNPPVEKRMGRFDFQSEALVWFNMCQDITYGYSGAVAGVLDTSGTYDIRPQSINAEWTPGFRLSMIANEAVGEIDFLCSYTYSHPTTNSHITDNGNPGYIISALVPENIQGSNTLFTEMTTRYEFKYQTFDLLLARKCATTRCQTITPFMGFEGVFTRLKLTHVAEQSTGEVSAAWDSDFHGYGVKVGSKFSYSSCEKYELFLKTSGTLLVGSYDAVVDYANTAGQGSYLTLKQCGVCDMIPGWHMQIGFSYHDCYCGGYFNAFFGYELIQWLGMPRPREMQDASSTSLEFVSNRKILGLQGLFFGCTFGF